MSMVKNFENFVISLEPTREEFDNFKVNTSVIILEKIKGILKNLMKGMDYHVYCSMGKNNGFPHFRIIIPKNPAFFLGEDGLSRMIVEVTQNTKLKFSCCYPA